MTKHTARPRTPNPTRTHTHLHCAILHRRMLRERPPQVGLCGGRRVTQHSPPLRMPGRQLRGKALEVTPGVLQPGCEAGIQRLGVGVGRRGRLRLLGMLVEQGCGDGCERWRRGAGGDGDDGGWGLAGGAV